MFGFMIRRTKEVLIRRAIPIFLLFLSIFGCKEAIERRGEVMEEVTSISGKRILMIIASRNFRDEEYDVPAKLFRAAKAEVTVASSSLSMCTGMFGAKAKPDILLTSVSVVDYDAVVFIGGSGSSEYFNNPTAHRIAQEAVKEGKVLGAICIAPVTLANAGVLSGKRATVFSSSANQIKAKGANYTGRGVEVDGDIITGDGPESARAFAEAIIEALSKK
jgi:protease I